MKTMQRKTVSAGELTVGMQVAERDGYLLTVREIVKQTPKTITLKLGSDFSPMRAVRVDGIEATLRKSSKVVTIVEVDESASA